MKNLPTLTLCALLLSGCGAGPGQPTTTPQGSDAPEGDVGGEGDAGRPVDAGDDTTEETDAEGSPDASEMTDTVPGYEDLTQWLCHPERADDPCDEDLDITRVLPDGTTEIVSRSPSEDPAIDCFYVYPTTSLDPTPNSDRIPGPEERFVVQSQVAQLGTVCRLFAPMYRQITVSALFSGDPEADRALAYSDVASAFEHYMTHENEGRGVVLVGHSQGTGMLNQLIQDVFDQDASMREQLVAAYLIGLTVAVPEGEDVGGTFANVPLCREPSQTGCVVTYASFRATAPPGPGALFGRADEGLVAGCTNPAALQEGATLLSPIFPSTVPAGLQTFIGGQTTPWANPSERSPITTGFYELPGIAQGTCVAREGASYFEITTLGEPDDPRIDNLGGDLAPGWGLHLIDMNLAARDIMALIQAQAQAYTSR